MRSLEKEKTEKLQSWEKELTQLFSGTNIKMSHTDPGQARSLKCCVN